MNQSLVRKLHVRQHFHSVGNGFFYGLDITDHDSKEEGLLFIYDCGAKSKKIFLQRELSTFNKRHDSTRAIDILVISSFDEVYFKGLFELLENRKKGENVFLPYLNMDERKRYSSSTHSGNSDYLYFLNDPDLFLKKYFKKVYYVKKAEHALPYTPNHVGLGEEHIELVTNAGKEDNIIDDNSYLKTNLGWLFYFHTSASGDRGTEKNLSCIHGPLSLKHCFPTGFWYSKRKIYLYNYCLRSTRWLSFGGKDFCVLTGAMNLKTGWDDLKIKLQKMHKRISIFIIPNCQKYECWNSQVASDLDPDAWIISSQFLSFFKFNNDVISDLKDLSRGAEICKIHEFRDLALERILILKVS